MINLSQNEKILKLLTKAGNKGVPNYDFPKHKILRYSSRITELRKEGYNIYTERQKLPNGRATGVFRYYLLND
jgi:hypothetical protein